MRTVPKTIEAALTEIGWEMEDVDSFVMHQANRYILNHLAKRMNIPDDKFPICMKNFGNTSAASIPITLTEMLSNDLTQSPQKLIMSGFGVGWSWGTVALTCGPIIMSDLVTVTDTTQGMIKS